MFVTASHLFNRTLVIHNIVYYTTNTDQVIMGQARVLTAIQVLMFLVGITSCLQMRQAYLERQEGKYLTNRTFQTEHASSETDCAGFCLAELSCTSANYKVSGEKKGACELNKKCCEDAPKEELKDHDEYIHLVIIGRSMEPDVCAAPIPTEHDYECLGSAVIPELSVTNYIKSRSGPESVELAAITGCIWVRNELDNTLPYISYAIEGGRSNEFLFGEHGTLSLWIQDSIRSATSETTELPLRVWHSLCVSWENTKGEYKFYINGSERYSGTDLEAGVTLGREGMWVLGHDQDSFDGGFQASQMVKGELANANIWDRVLSSHEIAEVSSMCNTTLIGNVKSWKDFQEGLQGDVFIKKDPLCCRQP